MNSSTVCEGCRVRNLIRGSLNGLPAYKKWGRNANHTILLKGLPTVTVYECRPL